MATVDKSLAGVDKSADPVEKSVENVGMKRLWWLVALIVMTIELSIAATAIMAAFR
jgi:hypothetical protein